MATIYADASGNIVTYLRDYTQEQWITGPTPGSQLSFVFDENTNPGLALALNTSTDTFALSGDISASGSTVLLHKGVPITANPSGLISLDRQALATIWPLLKADQPLTAAQLRQVLRFILRLLYQNN